MKKLTAAIIGCGVIAPEHINAYRMLENVEVKTLCDIDAEKARMMSREFDVPVIETESEKVFNDRQIDIVSICTDHFSHSELAVSALKAGKHVLCEKPLSSSAENIEAMLDEGKKHDDLVFAGVFQHRFNPLYRYIRELVGQGAFGRVLNGVMTMQCMRTKEYYESASWRGKWHTEGGSVLMNQAIHTIDIFQWIMGGVADVCGTFDNLAHENIIETEDTAAAFVRFKNGALGTITASSASHLGWDLGFSIYGTKSSIELKNAALVRFVSEDKELEKQVLDAIASINEVEAANKEKSYYGIGHIAVVRDFVDAIREKRRPYVTAADAAEAVMLSQKILGRV